MKTRKGRSKNSTTKEVNECLCMIQSQWDIMPVEHAIPQVMRPRDDQGWTVPARHWPVWLLTEVAGLAQSAPNKLDLVRELLMYAYERRGTGGDISPDDIIYVRAYFTQLDKEDGGEYGDEMVVDDESAAPSSHVEGGSRSRASSTSNNSKHSRDDEDYGSDESAKRHRTNLSKPTEHRTRYLETIKTTWCQGHPARTDPARIANMHIRPSGPIEDWDYRLLHGLAWLASNVPDELQLVQGMLLKRCQTPEGEAVEVTGRDVKAVIDELKDQWKKEKEADESKQDGSDQKKNKSRSSRNKAAGTTSPFPGSAISIPEEPEAQLNARLLLKPREVGGSGLGEPSLSKAQPGFAQEACSRLGFVGESHPPGPMPNVFPNNSHDPTPTPAHYTLSSENKDNGNCEKKDNSQDKEMEAIPDTTGADSSENDTVQNFVDHSLPTQHLFQAHHDIAMVELQLEEVLADLRVAVRHEDHARNTFHQEAFQFDGRFEEAEAAVSSAVAMVAVLQRKVVGLRKSLWEARNPEVEAGEEE